MRRQAMKKISYVPLESSESKKHKRHQLWRNLIKDYKESGLRRKEFCNQHSIKADDLERWKHRLAKLDAVNGESHVQIMSSSASKAGNENFTEVYIDKTVAKKAKTLLTTSAPPCDFQVTLMTGAKIIVPSHFTSEALCRLLHCLGGEETC